MYLYPVRKLSFVNICVAPVTDPEQWDSFVLQSPQHTFLQAWRYGESLQEVGHIVLRIGLFDGAELVGAAQLVRFHLKPGSFLHCPHGPLLHDWTQTGYVDAMFDAIAAAGRTQKVAYVRLNPPLAGLETVFQAHGCTPAPIQLYVENTWIIDLTPSPQVLLRQMRRTTRNAIRDAVRAGVEVTVDTSLRDLPLLLDLYAQTAADQRFEPIARQYIEAEARAFARSGDCAVVCGWRNGVALAAVLVIFHGHTAYAHFGASSRVAPRTFAPHLVQWRIIETAQARGCRQYDLWGIAPAGAPDHPWAGFSVFKRGFGGREIRYVHAHDLPLKSHYLLVHFVETLRRRRRGLPLW